MRTGAVYDVAAMRQTADAARDAQFQKNLGYLIRVAREARDMSQSDLGRVVGLSLSTIGRVERGETSLLVAQIPIFAKALDLPELAFVHPPPSPDRLDLRRYLAHLADTTDGRAEP